jgi:hypothetical protein
MYKLLLVKYGTRVGEGEKENIAARVAQKIFLTAPAV